MEAVAGGATGYLGKCSQLEELVDAVQDVAEGRLRVPDMVSGKVLAMLRELPEPAPRRPQDKLAARSALGAANVLKGVEGLVRRAWQTAR